MSLTTIPNELLLKIGSYLIPQSLDLPGGPFSDWDKSISDQGLILRRQAKSFYAFSQSCRKIYNIFLRHPTHAHLRDPKMRMLQAVLKQSDFKTMSVYNVRRLHLDICFGDIEINSAVFDNPNVINTTIEYVYLECCNTPQSTLPWLLKLLPGLKTLHIKFRNGTDEVSEHLFAETMQAICDQKLESLTLTVPKSNGMGSWEVALSGAIHLKILPDLTTLKISHSLLLGRSAADTGVYKLLPSSLVQLEVFQDGLGSNPFIVRTNDQWWSRSACRPDWLFFWLHNMNEYTPMLERIRIISDEHWGDVEDVHIWDRSFVPHPKDWVKSEGKKAWKPPMELVNAFEKAKVNFGLYIQPDVCFRLQIANVPWFNDNWERQWDKDRMNDVADDGLGV